MAAAWIDDAGTASFTVPAASAAPLWVGERKRATFFASTGLALEVVEHYTGITLRRRTIDEGTLLVLNDGRVVKQKRFKPQRNFEERSLPAFSGPSEGKFCLERLAILRAAA